jgi:hypothetical protein
MSPIKIYVKFKNWTEYIMLSLTLFLIILVGNKNEGN